MTSGEALLSEMKQQNISIQDLAQKLKVDIPFLGEIISDQRKINSYIAIKLTSAFDKSASYWLKFTTQP